MVTAGGVSPSPPYRCLAADAPAALAADAPAALGVVLALGAGRVGGSRRRLWAKARSSTSCQEASAQAKLATNAPATPTSPRERSQVSHT